MRALIVVGLLALLAEHAITVSQARDDGRYAQAPLKKWFDGLKNQNGAGCCSDADGFAVSDVDWETSHGTYRVRLNDQWHEVPPEALITVPNLAKRTMVWPITDISGKVHIHCFMPGPMA